VPDAAAEVTCAIILYRHHQGVGQFLVTANPEGPERFIAEGALVSVEARKTALRWWLSEEGDPPLSGTTLDYLARQAVPILAPINDCTYFLVNCSAAAFESKHRDLV
jgi:hypothetical protein